MIKKWYEVTCDGCGACIDYYYGLKPSNEELRKNGVVVKGDKQFCNEDCMRLYHECHGNK